MLSSLHHIATCKLPDLNSSSEYASLVIVYYLFNPRCSSIFLNLFYSFINENTQKWSFEEYLWYVQWTANKTRMHSSRMRTTRSLPYWGVSLTQTPLDRDPPGQRPSPEQRPLWQRPPLDRTPPWTESPLDRDQPLPWTDRCLWKYYLTPNFACGW